MRGSLAFFCALALVACAPSQAVGAELQTRLETLSKAGNGEAAYHLGMLYHLGLEGTKKDARKAFDLFKLAAERGDPLGAYKLGCYYDGQGEGIVEDDPVLALRYKLIAAEAGYSRAQTDVARHFFQQDKIADGLRWLEAAAAQGDVSAMMAVGGLYSQDAPVAVPKDPVKSYAYLMAAFADAPKEFEEVRPKVEAELAARLTPEQLKQAKALVAGWKARPSALTLKANSGLDAAKRLAAL